MLINTLENKFFPFIEKPGRYIGGEPGSYRKDSEGLTTIALAYPDMYEVGMSYTGGQILYHVFNSRPDTVCERVYTPAPDALELMKRENIPLFSLESHRSVKEFDVLGFTLSYEMIYTNVLGMLDLAGIPLLSKDRDNSDPLIIAGGPICYNPEPIADFFDAIFIGEIEETIPALIAEIKAGKELPRQERLKRLANIPSFYIPSLYHPETHKPLVEGIPEKITASHVSELKPEYYPKKPIVPLIESTHDRVAAEIMRGCPQGCRFCQAGKIYKPVRVRSVNDIKTQVLENLEATGYEEVGLLSLSSTDYPHIEKLTLTLAAELEKMKVSLSFPSLRPASFTTKIANAAKLTRKTGLTFAPEVGTERMRQVVRKSITEEDLLSACQIAFEKGWQLIKLYFMIGLPTETKEDLDGIVDLIYKVLKISRAQKGQKKINVTISPFSPKAHTPFQWDEVCSPDIIREKQDYLRGKITARDVSIKFRNPRLSYLEGVIGRGDRKIGEVILCAYKNGAMFDGWTEYFDINKWTDAFTETGINMSDYAEAISFTKTLPWDHIDRGQSKEHLQNERSQSAVKAVTPVEPTAIQDTGTEKNSDDNMFGRRKKRVPVTDNSLSPTRGKLRLKWKKHGLARFLSHLENNKILQRAIRRANIPVVYSQGFHPHQKLSFGPPLPLGYSSDSEFLDIQIEGNCNRNQVFKMNETMPYGYLVDDFKLIYSKAPAISAMLNRAFYTVNGDLGDLDKISDTIENLLSQESIIAIRSTKEGGKKVEIRPAIYKLTINQENEKPFLDMELGLGNSCYAKPSELMTILGLWDEQQLISLQYHRKALMFKDEMGYYYDPLTAII